MEREISMKKFAVLGVCAILAGCGADGTPLAPTAGLGIGIGPGGVKVRPKVTVSDGTSAVNVGTGGVSAGTNVGGVNVGTSGGGVTASTSAGPVSVSGSL